MAIQLRTTVGFQRLNGSNIERGQWPLEQYDVTTTSDLREGEKLQVVGTSHEALAPGDVTAIAHVMIAVASDETATVQIGRDVGGTFYPVCSITGGDAPIVLPRVATALGNLYLQSDAASTNVYISLQKIA